MMRIPGSGPGSTRDVTPFIGQLSREKISSPSSSSSYIRECTLTHFSPFFVSVPSWAVLETIYVMIN